MKIVALGASSSKQSVNQQFAEYVAAVTGEVEVDKLYMIDYELPLYSIDKEKAGEIPEKIHEFINRLAAADGVVLSLAEHNGTYTAVFKNLMDWASRVKLDFFDGKPLFLLSTSPGGYGGGNVMEAGLQRLPKFDANIVAQFSLPKYNDNFDLEKGVIDAELNKHFTEQLDLFKSALEL